MTRLDRAQQQFATSLQLHALGIGDDARVPFTTLAALIDCAQAYIESTDCTEALESAEFLLEEDAP